MSDTEDDFVSASEGEDDSVSHVLRPSSSTSQAKDNEESVEVHVIVEEKAVNPSESVLTALPQTNFASINAEKEAAPANLSEKEPSRSGAGEGCATYKDSKPEEVSCGEESDADVVLVPAEKVGKVQESRPDVSAEGAKEPPTEGKESVEISEKSGRPTKEEDIGGGWDDWGNDEDVKEEGDWDVEWHPEDSEAKSAVTIKAESGKEGTAEPNNSSNSSSAWGWGGMLSAVGEKFSNAVESSLGLPSAEEMARRSAHIEKIIGSEHNPEPENTEKGQTKTESIAPFGVFSGIVSGGIDVLESIGKKTFETITVKEPHAGGRRRFIFEADRGQNLSEVLREIRAKQEAEQTSEFCAGTPLSQNVLPDVASSFERSDGMIHLEALELMASCRNKPKSALQRQLLDQLAGESIEWVDGGEELVVELGSIMKAIALPYSPAALLQLHQELERRLRHGDGKSAEDLFKEGVDALVQFSSASVHLLSKLASLLASMGGRSDFSPFLDLFRCLVRRATRLASLYMLAISATDCSSHAEELATQMLVEASTAAAFIRQAHALVVPLLHH